MQQDAARLPAEHGDEPHRAGWMGKARALPEAADVFGVHPVAPGAMIYCVGVAVVLGGARLVEVTPGHAALVRPSGARLTYVRRPSPEAVLSWGLQA